MQNLESVEQVIEISFFNRALHSIDYHQSIIMILFLCKYAGRSAKEANLYTEISEGIYSYGITKHRHGKCFSESLILLICSKNKINPCHNTSVGIILLSYFLFKIYLCFF